MSDFITRLEDERDQLQDKYEKLKTFMESENFGKISEKQQVLLKSQVIHMQGYLNILNLRLDDLLTV